MQPPLTLTTARHHPPGRAAGHPRNPLATIVAATAAAHDRPVATDNERDRAGRPILDPPHLCTPAPHPTPPP